MTGQPDPPSKRSDTSPPAQSAAWSARWLVALILAALAAAAIAALLLLPGWFAWVSALEGPSSDLAETAAKTRPEIASLIFEAEKAALAIVRKFPQSADAMHALAYVHYRFGRAEKAIEYWQRCIELNPGFVPAYVSMGTLRQESGDPAAAETHFRKAKQLAPHSSVIPVQLAEALINQGKLAEAAELLQADLEQHPSSIPAKALLGHCLVQLHRYAEARDHLEYVVENAPGYTNAYYGLATACTKLGDREKAAGYLEEFRKLKARDEQAHRDSLEVLDDLGTTKRTVADVYTNAAMAALAQGDPQSAERLLLRAGELAPDYSASREVLAWLYQRQGRRDELLAVLEELVGRFGEVLSAQVTAGTIYAEIKQFDAAEQALQRAIGLAPHQAGAYSALARLYLAARRKLPEARRLALKAADREPTAENFLLLGLVCQAGGDTATAQAALSQAEAAAGPQSAPALPPAPVVPPSYRFSPQASELPSQ